MKCPRCLRDFPPEDLNLEATVHHGASEALCKDRKACERARRKTRRKGG